MKVLLVGSSMDRDWGGIERHIAHLAPALAARGHEVEAACAPDSTLAARVGVPIIPIRLRSQWDLRALAAYLRLFRSRRYDVVHTHFSPDYVMPALAARRVGQRGLVMTRHLALTWSRQKARRYLGLYDHAIGVSEAVRRALVESGMPEAFVTTAHSGCPGLEANAPRALVRQYLGIPDGVFAVGFFGRLVEEKGVQYLVEAARRLDDGCQVHVFGEGKHRAELERLALGEPVVFHGRVDDVADNMAAMDAVAMPSVWAEAFSVAALEAMSLGMPVVASNVGGIPEAIEDGVCGLLVPKEDPKALAEALSRLRDDPEFAQKLGCAARERQRSRFTVERMAERVEAVYMSASRMCLA